MPPKPKRTPHPALHHLKHSRQLLEDFLYQYLPQLSSMGSLSRINVYTWCNSRWGLSPDGKQGLPFMVLEALRLQRQHLLQHKLPLKPLSLTLLGENEDLLLQKSLQRLQEISSQSHTARVSALLLPWQDQLKQLQAQLLKQPVSERNLLILDPLELPLPRLADFLQLLPKKLDLLMVLPAAALMQAGGVAQKSLPAAAIQALALWLSPHLQPEAFAALAQPPTALDILQQLKTALTKQSNRFIMHLPADSENAAVVVLGITADALFMERMLQARQQLHALVQQQLLAGNQLGLFDATTMETAPATRPLAQQILQLFQEQPEWNNQELYKALLQQEILAPDASREITALAAAGKLELLNEKKKKQPPTTNPALSHTAYKLPAPSRYFRLKV